MKKYTLILSCLLAVSLALAGCSSKSSGSSGPTEISLTPDGVAAARVIEAYWAAFNKYDLNGCVACLDPTYSQTRAADVNDELTQFLQGKSLGVQMKVSLVTQAGVLADGELDLRVTMSIIPAKLQGDKYLLYYMIKESDGSWKINEQDTDYDKTPPRAPKTVNFIASGPNEVDITWSDSTNHETGYHIYRALDDAFQTELVTVTLPVNSTSYKDTTVQPGIKYWYRIVPFNQAGDGSINGNWPVTTPAS